MLYATDGYYHHLQGFHGLNLVFWLVLLILSLKKQNICQPQDKTILSAALGGIGAGGGIICILDSGFYSTSHMFQWGIGLELISLCILLIVIRKEQNENH